MKTLPRLVVLLVFVVAAFAATSSVALGASRLVYSDEFNGPLNKTNWTNDTPWNTYDPGPGARVLRPGQRTFANGQMTLHVREARHNGYAYTSGIVTSLPRAKFAYGYFEMRAKLPKGQGIWPAFWLTNDDTIEIDVFEMLGDRPHHASTRRYHRRPQVQACPTTVRTTRPATTPSRWTGSRPTSSGTSTGC